MFRLLCDAVEDQTLTLLDAGLVYACRAVGYRIPELVAVTGRSERTLWRRRRRAEELLAERLNELRRCSGRVGPAQGQGEIDCRVGECGVKGSLRRPAAALDPVGPLPKLSG